MDELRQSPETHPSVRHEPADISARWILVSLLIAGVFGAFLHVVVWGYFRGEEAYLNRIRASNYPLAPEPLTALPPEPRLEQLDRLQGIETPNVYLREKRKLDRLTRYGATDDADFVHIPIEQAIRILAAEKKLPVRKQSETRNRGLIDSGEPNSGRLFVGDTP